MQNNDQSASMSREFLDLKRDIEAFVNRFNVSARETAINPMLKDIEACVSAKVVSHSTDQAFPSLDEEVWIPFQTLALLWLTVTQIKAAHKAVAVSSAAMITVNSISLSGCNRGSFKHSPGFRYRRESVASHCIAPGAT